MVDSRNINVKKSSAKRVLMFKNKREARLNVPPQSAKRILMFNFISRKMFIFHSLCYLCIIINFEYYEGLFLYR